MEMSRQQQALVRSLYTRHGRKKHGMCVCEGMRAAGELFARRPELLEFTLVTAEAAAKLTIPGRVFTATDAQFAALAATVNSQGIIAVARMPEPASGCPADPFLLALDRIGDPGNFGTICRTARAAGLAELWYTAGSVDPFGDKAIRSALGAQFAMNLRGFDGLDELKRAAAAYGYGPVYLSDPHEGEDCFTAEGVFNRTVIVIGSESAGVGELAGAPRLTIPMPGKFESLNAAQAATILIFEYVRRSRR